ncbi:MAG: lysine--tRNA ligase [Planctomycetota bacterium]|jgi:lysyl-tRNA synthetase class 2
MLEKVQEDRLKKLQQVRELGVDPYGGRYDTAEPIADVLARYAEDTEGQTADIAGRLILRRKMGKMMFCHLRDGSAQMQIAFRKNDLDETTWELARLLDLGDIVAVAGQLQRTKTGEITVWARRLTLLCKSLNPMPEKFHGLVDTEIRYRQRYLDLMTNPEAMEVFKQRIAILEHVRSRLKGRGFVEVETPMMQAVYGGAAARPFETHHNALDCDMFMRISPELYLKRLLVGGMEKVFEINRNFRNEGLDTSHNPEFTMLELYQAYADYHVMMEITEELIATAAEEIGGGLQQPYGELTIDYTTPWPRKTYAELLAEHAGVDMADSEAVRAKARELHIDEAGRDDAVVINDVFAAAVEPALEKLSTPMFVVDYPAALCPLTRRKADDSDVALRFELYIAGMEIANAYTELNDPAIQEANFQAQLAGEDTEETMRVMDEDFVTALRHGMPPAGGLGIGVDRVIMLLTNTQSIRDVILFPMLRPQQTAESKPKDTAVDV